MGVMSIMLISCHVLFDLTENLLLESGLHSPSWTQAWLPQSVLQGLCVGWAASLPNLPLTPWQQNNRRVKNIVSLRRARRWTIPNRGRHCSSPDMKVPAVEMRRHGRLSHGKQAQSTPPDSLSFLSPFIWLFVAPFRCYSSVTVLHLEASSERFSPLLRTLLIGNSTWLP